MDLYADGLPGLDLLASPTTFKETLRHVFGDDREMMRALDADDLEEVASRLKPYAHGYPHGTLPTTDYTAPAITLERIRLALARPDSQTAKDLEVDTLKYQTAERFVYWISNHFQAMRQQRTEWRLGRHTLNATASPG